MDIPHMDPVIGIHEGDTPETKMLALLWGNPGCPFCQYIGTRTPPFGPPALLSSPPPLFTPVKLFGIRLRIMPNGFMVSRIEAESQAVHADGTPRKWRSKDGDRIRVRTHVAAIVALALSMAYV